MATKKATKKQAKTEVEAAAVEELVNFEPAFDKATMYEMEKAASSQGIGVNRRVALAVMTLGAEELSDVSIKDPDTYAQMVRATEAIERHLEAAHHVARAAAIRLRIADCRQGQ